MNSQHYTVSSVHRAFDDADSYGNVTDSVTFNETTGSFLYKHAPTTEVKEGTKLYGHTEQVTSKNSGKEYHVFKKDKIPDEEYSASKAPGRAFKKAQDDRGDGMRQGMCINNAANYVNSQNLTLGEGEWATMVYGYANALYALGDLKVSEDTAQDVLDLMTGAN